MDHEQLELDFGAPAEDGYACWQWDRRAAEERLGREYHLPLGRLVRLRLFQIDGEFVGRLELAARPTNRGAHSALLLRLGRMTFQSSEVEACVIHAPDGSEQAPPCGLESMGGSA